MFILIAFATRSVLMPLRVFVDSDGDMPAEDNLLVLEVLMPLRAFVDSDQINGYSDQRRLNNCLNALAGIC